MAVVAVVQSNGMLAPATDALHSALQNQARLPRPCFLVSYRASSSTVTPYRNQNNKLSTPDHNASLSEKAPRRGQDRSARRRREKNIEQPIITQSLLGGAAEPRRLEVVG